MSSEGKTAVTVKVVISAPVEMQRKGWQAILDNFKRHVEVEP